MKFKKWLIGLIAIFGLFIIDGLHSQYVYAMPSIKTLRGQHYWIRSRHIITRYGFRAYKIYDTVPESSSYEVRSKYIPKGTSLYVNYRGIEWAWTLNKHYYNYHHGYPLHHDYWVAGGGSYKWLPYTKHNIKWLKKAHQRYIKRIKTIQKKKMMKKQKQAVIRRHNNEINNYNYKIRQFFNNYKYDKYLESLDPQDPQRVQFEEVTDGDVTPESAAKYDLQQYSNYRSKLLSLKQN